MSNNERLQLLISVAKLYYEENMNQNEIANIIGVSRPLISKYLQEAKSLGLVKIEIIDLSINHETSSIDEMCRNYNLKSIYVIPSSSNRELNDSMFEDNITNFLLDKYIDNSLIGLGWGSVIGNVIAKFNPEDRKRKILGKCIPLISNAPISYRNYHTNELVRMLADKSNLKAQYLYCPVICSNPTEKEIFVNSEQVKSIFTQYKKLDYSIIQVRNFPSVPDLATELRFEKKLITEKAVGMVLGYYYDVDGRIISSLNDHSIQISLEDIKSSMTSVAIINARVTMAAAIGAIKSGLFNSIIISEFVLKDLKDNDLI